MFFPMGDASNIFRSSGASEIPLIPTVYKHPVPTGL